MRFPHFDGQETLLLRMSDWKTIIHVPAHHNFYEDDIAFGKA